jgi:hypothetical protein
MRNIVRKKNNGANDMDESVQNSTCKKNKRFS